MSSVWSIDTERSSSSLSWEEECDEESQNDLQNLLDSIDNIVFFDSNVPKDFPNELVGECLVWKNKFNTKMERNSLKFNKKQNLKSKSLSAPKLNSKQCLKQRTLSEQTFASKMTKLESLSIGIQKMQNDLTSKSNEKPLILPPITYTTLSKSNDKSSNVPTIFKSFPKPPPILSIEQILFRSTNIEENDFPNLRSKSLTNKTLRKTRLP